MSDASRTPGVLVVVAHPDDESFGLGAIIGWLRRRSVPVRALVFTRGGASRLGANGDSVDLGRRRARELACASRVLGLADFAVLDYPDGGLSGVPLGERVRRIADFGYSETLLAFDDTGVTGHPDHTAATEAATFAAAETGAALYLWTLSRHVATELNCRLGTSFQGRPTEEIAVTLEVGPERRGQWQAIACHRSQAGGLDVVRTRLELLGDREYLVEQSPSGVGCVFDRRESGGAGGCGSRPGRGADRECRESTNDGLRRARHP